MGTALMDAWVCVGIAYACNSLIPIGGVKTYPNGRGGGDCSLAKLRFYIFCSDIVDGNCRLELPLIRFRVFFT